MRFFTHAHLIPIQSSRSSILSNLLLFLVGVLFVLCVASPRKNLSQGPSFGGCGFIYASFMSKLCCMPREILNGAFKSTNYARENTGAGNNF